VVLDAASFRNATKVRLSQPRGLHDRVGSAERLHAPSASWIAAAEEGWG